MIRIGLLRHGRTSWNRQGLMQGQTDIPLEDGEPDRISQFALPEPWDKAAIVASPLSRAFETARIVSGRPPPTDARLMESSFGDWEGKDWRVIRADPASGFLDIEERGWDYRAPGGESLQECWDRVWLSLSELTEDTLIVCHMNIMRVVLAKAYGWNFDGPVPFKIKRDRIYGVTLDAGLLTADPDPIRLVQRCA